jgi:catechol 2,3-dioxygenase-like lactoylglutathione lyase family enzyme
MGLLRCSSEHLPAFAVRSRSGGDMKPRIKVLTLAVNDLERSLAFYRDGLGLPTKGIIGQEYEDGAVVFINMGDELILALFPATSLSKDAGIVATDARLGAVSIGHIVNSKEEVDAVMTQAADAGAVITEPARDRFWGGYSGYFHDPDGHLWEIAWNPQWVVED